MSSSSISPTPSSTTLLEELLNAIDSHLDHDPPVSSQSILIVQELSVLSVVLFRKWVQEATSFGTVAVKCLSSILRSCGVLDPNVVCQITVYMYGCVVQLLSSTLHAGTSVQGTRNKGEQVVGARGC